MGIAGIVKWIVSKIMPALKTLGIGVDRQYDMISPSLPDLTKDTFVGMAREYESIIQKSERLQTQPIHNLFDVNYMVESDMPRGRRYMIQYRFEVFDRDTGKTETLYRNVYEMERNSLQGWLEKGRNYFEVVFEKYQMEVISASVHNVFHKIGWKY